MKPYPNWRILALITLAAFCLGIGAKVLATEVIVPPALAQIFDPDAPVSVRLKCVHDLGEDLRCAEVSALCRFLEQRPGPLEKNLPALQLVKNDLLNALMEQRTPPPELTSLLIRMSCDSTQDDVTRDYAIQHLVTWYELGASETEEAKNKTRAVLAEFSRQETSLAGTALLGMHLLAMSDPAFSHQEISRRALEMARSPSLVAAARITAIQICAEEGAMEAVPLVRSLALADHPLALRISAIAALGRLGSADDMIKLQELDARQNPGLRAAIHQALRQLAQKFHPQKLV